MSVDFSKLLSKPMDTVERPKPLPPGTYFGSILRYEYGESKEKKTPYVRFHLNVQSPGEGVDSSALTGVDFSKKQLRRDFYLTPDSEYRLKDFIASCGIQTEGRTFGESIPDTVNLPVMIEVTQRNSQDGTEVYNDVGSVVGVK